MCIDCPFLSLCFDRFKMNADKHIAVMLLVAHIGASCEQNTIYLFGISQYYKHILK